MISHKCLLKIFKAGPSKSLLLLPDFPRFTIKEVSDAYLEATGTKEAALIDKGVFEAFPDKPNAVQCLSASFEQVLKTKQTHKTTRRCYDFSECSIQHFFEKAAGSENIPILNDDGEVAYILHNLIDVAGQSEAHLAEAQRLAKIGSWDFDLRNKRLSWSEELYNVFGTDKQTFTETHSSFVDFVDTEDKEIVRQASRHTQETGEPFTIEYRINTPKRERKIIQEHGYGETDAHGNVIRLFGTAQDVTEYREAEQALRLRDELYGFVTKATNDSIWDWDLLKNEVLRPGKKLETLFGYQDIGAPEVDAFWRAHVHPDDWADMTQKREMLFANPKENFWEGEYRFLKPCGQYGYVHDRGYIIRNKEGKAIRMIGASRDITREKEYINEIIRIQQNLDSLINTTDDLIWSVDTAFKIITANKAFGDFIELLTGRFIGEGDNILTYFDEAIANKWTGLYNRALAGERVTIEGPVHNPKLKDSWHNIISLSPITGKDGNILGVACFAKDITELKRSEKRYGELFHLCPEPLWVYEMETLKFIQVNKAAIEQYGYSEEEFLGMTILDIRPADDTERVKEIVNKQKKNQTGIYKVISRHHKKNSENIDVEISTSPLLINGKECRLVIAVDVTEKNLFERRLTKAIIKTQEDERYEIGSELHDNVCQLLVIARLNLEMLRTSLPPSEIMWLDQCNENIILASDEMRNLSHRLAPSFFDDTTLEETFGRLLTAFNINGKYETVLHLEEPAKSYPLSHEIQLNLYRILQEQLRNILNYANAAFIEVTVLIQNNKLKMYISDDGVGFDVTTINKGIGFANIKRRAELFSGQLKIESSPGNGCKIIVEIPLSETK